MPPDERVDAVDRVDGDGGPPQRGHLVAVDGIATERDQAAVGIEQASGVGCERNAASRLDHGQGCTDHGVAVKVHAEGGFGGVVLGRAGGIPALRTDQPPGSGEPPEMQVAAGMPPDERVDTVDPLGRHGRPAQGGVGVVIDRCSSEGDGCLVRPQPAGCIERKRHQAGRLDRGAGHAPVLAPIEPTGSRHGGPVHGLDTRIGQNPKFIDAARIGPQRRQPQHVAVTATAQRRIAKRDGAAIEVELKGCQGHSRHGRGEPDGDLGHG